MKGLMPYAKTFCEISVNLSWFYKRETVRALAHTPAFCWSRIQLRLWSFSHIPALLLPVVSLILNAAQERCSYIEMGSAPCLCSYIYSNRLRYIKQSSSTNRFRHMCKFQCSYIETDKPAAGPAPGLSSSSPAHEFARPAIRPDGCM